jgi:transketolase
VGLAIASKHMAAQFNRPEFNLVDNKVWTFCGDGCLQEGISGEAASLAGHLALDNLIWVYDDNKITIDGKALIILRHQQCFVECVVYLSSRSIHGRQSRALEQCLK